MKVILLQDVPKLGNKYDVKEVSAGYARNFLISKKLASKATDKAIEMIKKQSESLASEKAVKEELASKSLKKIAGKTIILKEKANEKGHLFAKVNKSEIVNIIEKDTGVVLLEDMVVLENPIKEVGEHEIKLKAGESEVSFKLTIDAE